MSGLVKMQKTMKTAAETNDKETQTDEVNFDAFVYAYVDTHVCTQCLYKCLHTCLQAC